MAGRARLKEMPFYLPRGRSTGSSPFRGAGFEWRSTAKTSSSATAGGDVLLRTCATSGICAPSIGPPSGAFALRSGDVSKLSQSRRDRATAVLGVCMLLGMSGCAGTGQQISDFQRGWRKAEVLSVGRAEQITDSGYTDCRRGASAAETEASRYAVVVYRLGHRTHRHIIRLSAEAPVAPGDMVFANVEVCGLPIYPLASGPPSPR